jgi:folate-binding protein YgfZ
MFSLEQYQALQERAGLLDRSPRGRLQLTGQDRRDYLHGLLTNDIASLTAGAGCYAALLTPQGRMISDMRVSELGDRILIDLPARASDAVRQRLADFVFSEDVEVADIRESLAHLAIYGPRAASVLATVLGPSADDKGKLRTRAAAEDRRDRLEKLSLNQNATWYAGAIPVVVVYSQDYGIPGFELFVDANGRDELVRLLHDAGSDDLSLETAAVSRIEAGVPEFGADMDEHTIPLEAGIEDRAISLTKGCYVGQEVIIRVLHRGQGRVARRLIGFVAAPESGVLDRGERLLDADGVKDIGFVTSGVVSPRLGRPIGLGYVHRDYAEPGTRLRPAGGDGGEPYHLTVVTTPFTPTAAG